MIVAAACIALKGRHPDLIAVLMVRYDASY
jgi:hypothetical protein